LSLRPERVTSEPQEGQCPNIAEAKVEELIYLGDHIRTRISLAGNDEFIVKVPNAQGHARLAEGETVKVGWAMEDCRALDA
jgi:putative spermidine/putrescine transport system ATP-binding protein